MNKKYIILSAVVIVIIAIVVIGTNKPKSEVSRNTPLPVASQSAIADPSSWVPEIAHLRDRLNSINLPALSEEGSALHSHQHLDILINGKIAPVPGGIGINPNERFISPIHTHDASGVVHVESPNFQSFTLGQFFTIWGLKLTNTCIEDYCVDSTHTLSVYVNGKKVTVDPRTITLDTHQEIAIVYGTSSDIPKVIPSSYVFTAGE